MASAPSPSQRYILHTDGAAKGNPGPAGVGIALYREGTSEPVATLGEYIGETTNNVAEYLALIRGLKEALLRGVEEIEARTDSELMARQIAGKYKVSAPQILPLHAEARALLSRFARAAVVHIPREQNAMADKLANQGVASRNAGRAAAVSEPTPAPPAGPPTHRVPLSRFDALLDTDPWFGDKPATIRAVAEQARRIYDADLSQPVVLDADGQLIEGTHRIARAYLLGRTEIDVVQRPAGGGTDLRKPDGH